MHLLYARGVWVGLGLALFVLRYLGLNHSYPRTPESGLTMTLRPATMRDLDEITALALAALPDDPVWPYRFPNATLYPEHYHKYSRLRFWEYLSNAEAGVYEVMLVEVPSKDDPSVPVVIAMSMWQLPGWHLPKSGEPKGND